jgi:homoserine kinase type II
MLSKQTLSNEDLGLILQNFNFKDVLSVEPMSTSGNVSYIITTSLGKYFLRLSPDKGPRFRSIDEIYAEIELLYHLGKKNFPILFPIKGKDNRIIISLKGHNGYIRRFVRDTCKENPNLNQIEEFGKALGRFHSLTKNFRTKSKREHVFDLEKTREFFEEDMQYIINSDFTDKEEFISRISSILFSIDFPEYLPSGMIHEDLGKRHVLWNRNKISAILDFDRTYFGKLILDLGQACRGWCFTDNWSTWSNENFRALIEGYSKRRKLTNIEKRYLVDAIKFAIIERAISFSLRFIGTTQDKEDEDYALYSVLEGGLLDLVEKNRTNIEELLKEF